MLGKPGAVSDDVTLRGRGVIFFLKQAKIILRCRYAPGMPRPGVSKKNVQQATQLLTSRSENTQVVSPATSGQLGAY